MANSSFADDLDVFSPLTANGIDPDEARANRAQALAKMQQQNPYVTAADDPGANKAGEVHQPTIPPAAVASVSAPALPANISPSGSATGAASSSAAAPAAAKPVWADYARQGIEGQLGALSAATKNDATLQSMPSEDDAVDPLEAKRAAAATPINPQQDQYKPSLTQKILRGIGGFSKGGVLGAVDPSLVGKPGYSAPNRQYAIDTAQQTGNVASLDQQIDTARKNFADTSKRITAQAAERRSTAAGYKDVGQQVTGQEKAENDAAKVPIDQQNADAESQKAFNGSPDAKAQISQNELDQAQKQADQLHLTGTNRTLFLANGKIPDPRQATAEEVSIGQATAAWHRDNPGKQPSLNDINTIRQAAAGRGGAANAPSASGATGDDALAGLDPGTQAQVKAMAKGDVAMPSAGSRAPNAAALRQAVFSYDPTITDARYKAKQDFKTKGDANSIVQLSTALEHAARLRENSEKLGLSPLLSQGLSEDSTRYNEDVGHFTDEAGKLIKGAALTQAEEHDNKKGLLSVTHGNRSAAIDEKQKLLAGKVSALFEKYKAATGQDLPVHEFFDPKTQQRLQGLGVTGGDAPKTPTVHQVGDIVRIKGTQHTITKVHDDGSFD